MVTIDTEFKSDLASIQQHINDLDSKATTLNDCVSDFSGVRKRVNSAWPSGKTADAADVEMYNYAADLEDACNDIKTYKGYVQSLYDALTPVKDELEAMRGNAEDNDLEIKNNVIQEPEKPGNGASNGDKKDYDFKVRVFNRLKERSKKARDDEASAHSTFQSSCKGVLKAEIDPMAEYYRTPGVLMTGGPPSILSRAVDQAEPEIRDEPKTFSKLGDYAKAIGMPEKVVSIADQFADIVPDGGVGEQVLKGFGKLTGFADIGLNALQGFDTFVHSYQEQKETSSHNPENSPLEVEMQSTLRGAWEAGPNLLNAAAGAVGDIGGPLGSFLLGEAAEHLGGGAHWLLDGVAENTINRIGMPDWFDWTD